MNHTKQENTGRLTDKAFAHLILVAVLGILVCIVCLSATTYAWFTADVQSGSNEIRTAECRFSAELRRGDVTVATVVANGRESATVADAEGEYTVTVTLPAGSASGYLIVTVGGTDYRSDYLLRNEGSDQTLTFTLILPAPETLTLTARWGVYVGESHVENGTLTVN